MSLNQLYDDDPTMEENIIQQGKLVNPYMSHRAEFQTTSQKGYSLGGSFPTVLERGADADTATKARNHQGQTTQVYDEFVKAHHFGSQSFPKQSVRGTLAKGILDEFDAGTNLLKSNNNAYSVVWDENKNNVLGSTHRSRTATGHFEHLIDRDAGPTSIEAQYKDATLGLAETGVPLTPFSHGYATFMRENSNQGYGAGIDEQHDNIRKAYRGVLPDAQLSGMKSELAPVFSGANQLAFAPRPVMSSRGYTKNAIYLNGQLELPDEFRIDPREVFKASGNIPGDMIQTGGELSEVIKAQKMVGQPQSRTLASSGAVSAPPGFYDHITTHASEPLLFEDSGSLGYEFTTTERSIRSQ